MVKSFKKAIACLVAVLMVVCSMPFTAFAAELDDIDIDLIFSPVYMTGYQTASDEDMLAANTDYFKYTMLNEAPLTFNSKVNGTTISGNLVLEAEKQKYIAEYNEEDPIEEDLEYGVGDYFAVTVVAKNVSTLFATQNFIQYSENIEPAGYAEWTVGTGKKAVAHKGLASVSDAATKGATFKTGGLGAIDDFSAVNIYENVDSVLGNISEIDDENRVIKSINAGLPTGVDVSSVDAENEYTNPATGELNYTFDNTMICNTFIFKIVDEGEISFSVYDTDNTKEPGYGAAYYAQTKAEGYHTYAVAPNYPNGSTKLTFFGKNINRQDVEPECQHTNTTTVNAVEATCTTEGYTGDTKCTDCGEIIANGQKVEMAQHVYETTSSTTATCVDNGSVTYTCKNCPDTKTEYGVVDPTNHADVKEDKAVDATCTSTGLTAGSHCEACKAVIVAQEEVKMNDHDFEQTGSTTADCVTVGTVSYKCKNCPETKTEYGVVDPTNHADIVTDEAVDATCTKTGLTEGSHCEACKTTIVAQKETKALGHSFTDYKTNDDAVAATCTKTGMTASKTAKCDRCDATDTIDGTETKALGHSFTDYKANDDAVEATCTTTGMTASQTAKCDRCDATDTKAGTVIEALGHNLKDVAEVPATPYADGKAAGKECSRCDYTEGFEVIPATGVNVTVEDVNYGSTDMTGTNNVAYGSTVTIKATAEEGCTFVGYQIGGKIVSTDAEYTFTAYKDVTITPIFQQDGSDQITIIFYDKYNNVIATFDHAITAAEFPTAPVYAGYEFASWSVPVADINESTTVQAYYNQIKVEQFRVTTVDSANIEVSRGTELADANGYSVIFDTKATVSAAGATAWTVDGATVGYGESYTFYVGSDIHVEPVFDAVEASATVTMIKTYKISADSHKIMFLASMNVPSGFKLIDHGFVYGKNLTVDDMTLENVGNNGAAADAGVVKKTSAGAAGSEQFGISYGIKNQTGRACAVAYLTFMKDGKETTIYSDANIYDYATGTITVDEAIDD